MPADWVTPSSASNCGPSAANAAPVDSIDDAWTPDTLPRPTPPYGVNPNLGVADLPTPVVEDYVGAICSPWIDHTEIVAVTPPAVTADVAHEACVWASEILYVLSGRHWPGLCERMVRPCNQACSCGCLLGPTRPILDYLFAETDGWSMFSGLAGVFAGGWGGVDSWWGSRRPACCSTFGSCLSCRVDKLRLPGPIAAVRYVLIDGVPLDPSEYVVEGKNRLRRLNGGHWPCGQDFTRSPAQLRAPVETPPADPATAPAGAGFGWVQEWAERAGLNPALLGPPNQQAGFTTPPALIGFPQNPTAGYTTAEVTQVPVDAPPAWEIGYIWGRRPPRGGRYACRKLAKEIALSMVGDKACQLPWNTTTVTRRGVTASYGDPQALAADGMTGLWEVDTWLVAARGGQLRPRKPSVYRADAYRKGSGSGRPWTPNGI